METSICFGCGSKENLKSCGDCAKSVSALSIPKYCSKVCQQRDWATHKYLCAKNDVVIPEDSYILEGSPLQFIATRDIEPGQIVFQKEPLLSFPRSIGFTDEVMMNQIRRANGVGGPQLSHSQLSACFSCLEIMVYGERVQGILNKCRKCGWPVHSNAVEGGGDSDQTNCEKEHQEECKFFSNLQLTWDEVKGIRELGFCIALLRAWLLPEDKKKQLLDMPISGKEEFSSACVQSKDVETMRFFIMETCGITPKNPKDLDHLIVAVLGNMLPAPEIRSRVKERKAGYLILNGGPTGRILSQDCAPNCAWSFGPDLRVTFRTTRKVEEGDALTISLLDDDSFLSGLLEKAGKFVAYMIKCSCPRCTSDDEDGTFLSAVRLDLNSDQYYVPKKLDKKHVPAPRLEDFFKWICLTDKNLPALPHSKVAAITEPIRRCLQMGGSDRDGSYKSYKSFVTAHLSGGGHFHPTNGLVLNSKIKLGEAAMVEVLGMGFLQPNAYKQYLPPIEEALEVMRTFKAGWNNRYGQLLAVKATLEMGKLSEEVQNPENMKPRIEGVDKRVLDILRDLDEGLKAMIAYYPFLLKFGFTISTMDRYNKYGNYLLGKIVKNYPIEGLKGLPGFKKLKKGFWKIDDPTVMRIA